MTGPEGHPPDQRITLGFDHGDLTPDEFDAIKLAAELGLQPGQKRPSVAGPQLSRRSRQPRRIGW